tara:strand:+ start:226 stop:513 length:288 start_codon:yes stop_codon:yes gene_type:complete
MSHKVNDIEQEIFKVLENKRWKFASSMPKQPHEYTLREWWSDDDQFIKIVKDMRSCAYWGKFFSTPIKYWEYGEYKYWTMGYGLDQTKLINRAKL